MLKRVRPIDQSQLSYSNKEDKNYVNDTQKYRH